MLCWVSDCSYSLLRVCVHRLRSKCHARSLLYSLFELNAAALNLAVMRRYVSPAHSDTHGNAHNDIYNITPPPLVKTTTKLELNLAVALARGRRGKLIFLCLLV